MYELKTRGELAIFAVFPAAGNTISLSFFGRIAAHTVRPSSHSMHCNQLQIVVHIPAIHWVVQNCGRAKALEIGDIAPAKIAIARTNLTIFHSPPF